MNTTHISFSFSFNFILYLSIIVRYGRLCSWNAVFVCVCVSDIIFRVPIDRTKVNEKNFERDEKREGERECGTARDLNRRKQMDQNDLMYVFLLLIFFRTNCFNGIMCAFSFILSALHMCNVTAFSAARRMSVSRSLSLYQCAFCFSMIACMKRVKKYRWNDSINALSWPRNRSQQSEVFSVLLQFPTLFLSLAFPWLFTMVRRNQRFEPESWHEKFLLDDFGFPCLLHHSIWCSSKKFGSSGFIS